MLSVTNADIARMRDQLFFEGPEVRRRLSRFWMLLVLASIIAAAGVTSDSTATVIGAMIVAPLMVPILGIALAVVLADRANLIRSLLLVVTGAIAVIAVGWLMGHAVPYDVVAATNSQVAGRVSPRLIDLIAVLATGAVGAVALARSDISDTLPGVAIAISLVPPLSVVGLTLYRIHRTVTANGDNTPVEPQGCSRCDRDARDGGPDPADGYLAQSRNLASRRGARPRRARPLGPFRRLGDHHGHDDERRHRRACHRTVARARQRRAPSPARRS